MKKKLLQPAVNHLVELHISFEANPALGLIHFCYSDELKNKGN
jgi:hypothetical protein